MERPPTKPVAWLGSSLFDLRRAPADVRDIAGAQLALVEHGEMPRDRKPMPSAGTGLLEIRIRARTAHRILLTVKFHEAIYILHVFEKRSRKTARKNLEIGRARLSGLLRSRFARPSIARAGPNETRLRDLGSRSRASAISTAAR